VQRLPAVGVFDLVIVAAYGSSTRPLRDTAQSNTYVEKALTELKAEGDDVAGKAFQSITVELQEGGN